MKHLLKAYASFTRTERMGILALLSVIFILLVLRSAMHLWVNPPGDTAAEQALVAAWGKANAENKKQQQKTTTALMSTPEKDEHEKRINHNNRADETPILVRNDISEEDVGTGAVTLADNKKQQITTTTATRLFPFDPNVIDSAGLRLLGLREKTTSLLLNWRRKGKRFRRKEDLRPLYTLTEAEYKRLEPYITINEPLNARGYNYEEYGPLPAIIDLNQADSITLIRLRGIGPALAHRILNYRRANGRFSSVAQLMDVYKFPVATFAYLKEKLVVKSSADTKMKEDVEN